MPYTKAERAAYNKQHYLANKEKIRAQQEQWRLDNKQYNIDNPRDRTAYMKQYLLDNKEKISAQAKQWRVDNHRQNTIRQWITQSKVIHDDYDALYDEYLLATNCNICDVLLTTGEICKTNKVMDHCHTTGKFRQFLCRMCNWHLKD